MGNVRAATTVIADSADALLAAAAEGARRAGHNNAAPDRLDMIAHSMGAVSARWYAAKVRPDRVRTWISLAGANHGTNSMCPFSDDGSREMCPAFADSLKDNFVQVSLNGTSTSPIDETPFGLGIDREGVDSVAPDASHSILYLTVRIEPDDWIKPEQSAVLDGAGGVPVPIPEGVRAAETSPGNYLFFGSVDHDSLLDHPQLMELVEAMLSRRGPDQ
jgi:pimeloyl-ACP methyl ester carboxylesterase